MKRLTLGSNICEEIRYNPPLCDVAKEHMNSQNGGTRKLFLWGSIPQRCSDVGEFALQTIARLHSRDSRKAAGTPIAPLNGGDRYFLSRE